MYQSIQIPSGEISYYTLGEGKPLFLCYGFGGTFLHWEQDFLDALAQKFQVYCWNYRGIGFSKSQNDQFSIYEVAQDLSQMLDALKIQKASLLGYSMGGYIAQEFAFHFKDRLENLYLVSTAPGGDKQVPASPEIYKKMIPGKKTFEQDIQETLDFNFPKSYHEKLRAKQMKWAQFHTQPETYFTDEMRGKEKSAIEAWRKSFDAKKLKSYSQIQASTHIFTGLKDLIVPYQNSVNLCELIPFSKMTMFEDGGHGILSQFQKEIVSFIN